MKSVVVLLACVSIACGRVEVGSAPDDTESDAAAPDAGGDVDPTCLLADGACKVECRGTMEIADLYIDCRRHTETIGCSHHEGTCTPPDRCLYDPITGSLAFVRCSTPPSGWIDCPPSDAGSWVEDVIHGSGALPCGAAAIAGTCSISKGPTTSSTPCAAGETCTELGCRADHVGPVNPCGSIKCTCDCVDPTTSTCACYRP